MQKQQRKTQEPQLLSDAGESSPQPINAPTGRRHGQQQPIIGVDTGPGQGGDLNSPGLNQGFEPNESEDEADRREGSEDTDRPVRAP